MINSFKGRWYFLSNDFPARVNIGDESYPTVTHALLINNLIKPKKSDILNILECEHAHAARRFARKLKSHQFTYDSLSSTLPNLLSQKFEGNRLTGKLLETGFSQLIYENQEKDIVLGTYKGIGLNLLGTFLMAARGKYRGDRQRPAL